jgi:hypothetical protein
MSHPCSTALLMHVAPLALSKAIFVSAFGMESAHECLLPMMGGFSSSDVHFHFRLRCILSSSSSVIDFYSSISLDR